MMWKQWFLIGMAAWMGSAWATTPSVVVVEPLCKATEAWNQAGALNANIHMDKGYPCGCDPLAWGQVLTHHGLVHDFPKQDAALPKVTRDVYLYNGDGSLWKVETRTTSGKSFSWADTRDQKEDVSRLMYDLGVLGNTAYRPGGTSGTVQRADVASVFGYKGKGWCYTLPYYNNPTKQEMEVQPGWQELIVQQVRASLHAGAPMVVSLHMAAGGHAVVCDGYGYADDGSLLFHFHYGWGKGSDTWKPASWWANPTMPTGGDRFMVVNVNVHPEDLGCVVAGRVTVGGKAVESARVTLKEGVSCTTDATGSYTFTGLPENTAFTLTVTAEGHEEVQKQVRTGRFVDDMLRGQAQDKWEEEQGKETFHWVPLEGGNVIADIALTVPNRYVTPNGTGDGSSWETAASLTQAFLDKHSKGTKVFAAAGNYIVKEILRVPAGVTLMGGYNPTTGFRNVYGSPSMIILHAGADGKKPSYIFELPPTALVDGFVLENNLSDVGATINGGTVKNCIFTGSFEVVAQNATLRCCIMRNAYATQEKCSLIHCTFYGDVPTGKGGGSAFGNREKAKADFPDASLVGTCTCGQCPSTALNGRSLNKTPGALATPAPGFTLNVR